MASDTGESYGDGFVLPCVDGGHTKGPVVVPAMMGDEQYP